MQITNAVFLVQPAAFSYNEQTAVSNAFQSKGTVSAGVLQKQALVEFKNFVQRLRSKGVIVHVFEDTVVPTKPDAIFPNNWISVHADGRLVLYPMCTPNRRLERREDIVKLIQKERSIKEVIDYSIYEKEGRFLEGTGSIIFDRLHKKAYACCSPRTNQKLFEQLMKTLGYKAITFRSQDKGGIEIYHTNVMMGIGDGFVVICLESIFDSKERTAVIQAIESDGLILVDISLEQVKQFAGNVLALQGIDGQLLVLSQSAFDSLTVVQRNQLEAYCELLPMEIPTIEKIGGGSARCMIAEIF